MKHFFCSQLTKDIMHHNGLCCCWAGSWSLTSTSWEAHSLIAVNYYKLDAPQESGKACLQLLSLAVENDEFLDHLVCGHYLRNLAVLTNFITSLKSFRLHLYASWQSKHSHLHASCIAQVKGTWPFTTASLERLFVWKLTWFIGDIIWLPSAMESYKDLLI